MVLSEIKKTFEKRKNELYIVLNERKSELKPEIQHQMYGAMNEIDIFLRTLDHYREKEVSSEMKKLKLIGPVTKSSNKFSKFFININEGLTNLKFKSRKQKD